MKYKVIGWTSYENYDIPFYDKTIGFAERNAIIDEVIKHKYLFSGWHHQESWDNCVPILNDGKKRGFSQRGWGGLMAEAYGKMGDYDYASFTFYQSIDSRHLRIPYDEFDPSSFVSETLENEHFDVNLSEELFAIAKTKNPFYLNDEDSLRYIDNNDTITLHCNDQTLTFLVKDVDRNKKEIKFNSHHLIDTKYKIIITHKPMAKVIQRKPILVLRSDVNKVFKKCIKTYDFNTLLELFDSYNIEEVTKKSKSLQVISVLKKFINEYIDYDFNASIVNKVLYYIDDYEFSKEISYKVIKINPSVFSWFVNHYFQNGVNVDEHIPTLLKISKNDYYNSDLILRGIELNPNNKSLRKRYYKELKYLDLTSFILYMGINEFKSLTKEHRQLVELDDFNKVKSSNIIDIAQLMSYPNYNLSDDNRFPYRVPNYYTTNNKCVNDGILKYQEYVNEKYNLSNRLEELFICGIKKSCNNMEEYLHGEENAASYVYALDALSGFKYSLKEKVEKIYPELKEFLDYSYNK